MEPSGISTSDAVSSPAPRRSWLLPVLLVVSVGAALAYRTTHLKTAVAVDPLHSNSEEAPGALMQALEAKPPQERLPFLLKSVQDPSAGLRYAAVDALDKYHDPPAVDAVETAFRDLDSETRKRALEVLPDMDPDRGLKVLLSGLRDEDPWIRESAATQIVSRISTAKARKAAAAVDGRAVPMLVSVLDDPDPDVSSSAMVALGKLTGKPWRSSRIASQAQHQAAIAKWKGWWTGARTSWPAAAAYADVPPTVPTRTEPCPDFHLDRLDGKELSRQSQLGRLTLLNFWNTQCGPCVVETPDFVEVDRRFHGRNVDVIRVTIGDNDTRKLQDWCRAHGVTFPQALGTPEVTHVFGDIEDLPVTVLIDGQGRIRNVWQGGPRDSEVFCSAISRVLKEKG